MDISFCAIKVVRADGEIRSLMPHSVLYRRFYIVTVSVIKLNLLTHSSMHADESIDIYRRQLSKTTKRAFNLGVGGYLMEIVVDKRLLND